MNRLLQGRRAPDDVDAPPTDAGPQHPVAALCRTTASLRSVFFNLMALGAIGVLLSGWILLYTDWFPLVGGLLGLGGVFAWIAFLSGLLTDERKKEFQNGFERFVLAPDRTWKIGSFLVLVQLYIFSLFGPLILDSHGDSSGHLLEAISTGSTNTQRNTDYILPQEQMKVPLFCGWTGRRNVVKVSGFPSAIALVSPFGRTRLRLPASFWVRPVVLVRLSPTLSADAAQGLFALTVRINGRIVGAVRRVHYRGESAWVGCEADVAIPEKLASRWRSELARLFKDTPGALDRGEEILGRWIEPLTLAESAPPQVGDVIDAALTTATQRQVARGRIRVRSSRGGALDVQEVYLKYPDPVVATQESAEASEGRLE